MSRLIRCLLTMALLAVVGGVAANEPSWSQPRKPFRVYANTWYVGSAGLSAILITSPKGHILIDGTLTRNAPMIEANIRALGFHLHDIRVILNSHAHHDHAGAIAALARDSGARVIASAEGARELEAGGNDPGDPLNGDAARYPPVPHVQTVRDGGVVHVGPLAIMVHDTPGHTPGNASFTWRSCNGSHCQAMVYVGSLTAIGRPGYRFSAHPQVVASFRRSFRTVAALPCDILLTPHPDASDFMARVAARDRGVQPDPLVDAGACKRFAARSSRDFDAVLAKERAAH